MVSVAFCLIKTETDKLKDAVEYLDKIEGVKIEQVSGNYDIVARVEEETPKKLREKVDGDITKRGKIFGKIFSVLPFYLVEGFTRDEKGEVKEVNFGVEPLKRY